MSTPALRAALNAVRKLYPESLAAGFDNTGLLLEPLPVPRKADSKPVVLLTIDLTRSVAEEAVKLGAFLVISYHPIIFRGLKSLTQNDTQQQSLLQLAQHGISVYSPHTSVDAAIGGVNDWLAQGISGGEIHESSRTVIEQAEKGAEGEGCGRLVVLKEGQSLETLVGRVKKFLKLSYLQVAASKQHASGGASIHSIGICAGSGGGVFQRLGPVDLLFTGELSHHEALAAVEKGISVISCFHSNTERGFLGEVMKGKLEEELRNDEDGKDVEVVVSETDKDPYTIV